MEFRASYEQGDRTPAESQQTLCQVVFPSHYSSGDVAFGGFVVKFMDNEQDAPHFGTVAPM
jgi:acyl-CoA hydrolase